MQSQFPQSHSSPANAFFHRNGVRHAEGRAAHGRRMSAFTSHLLKSGVEPDMGAYNQALGWKKQFIPAQRDEEGEVVMRQLLLMASTLSAMRELKIFSSGARAHYLMLSIKGAYKWEGDPTNLKNLAMETADFISSKRVFNELLLSRPPFNDRHALLYELGSILSLAPGTGPYDASKMEYGLGILRDELLSTSTSSELFLPGVMKQISNSFNLKSTNRLIMLPRVLGAQEEHVEKIGSMIPQSSAVFKALLGLANTCGYFLDTWNRSSPPTFLLKSLDGLSSLRMGGINESGTLKVFFTSDTLSDDLTHVAMLRNWISSSFGGIETRGPCFETFDCRFAVFFEQYSSPVLQVANTGELTNEIIKWENNARGNIFSWKN